tara:strand:+ start:8347 stop:8862 length:516 start_codon:yes stop_codon:yes gene_type:complete
MGATTFRDRYFYLDKSEYNSIINSLERIRRDFGDTKTKEVARKASKPLKDEMKRLAPVYPNNKEPKKKWYYYRPKGEKTKRGVPYKKGTVRRSVATFAGKRGIFVAPRIGRLHEKVLGNQRLDGWYAHFVIGGTPNIKIKKPFVERARLSKRVTVLREIKVQAEKMLEKNW